MKSKILGISAVCLLMFAERGKTQNNPYNEVSIASPNAASLGKFVDLPVNYHTGLPQVDIPIYTIKEGTLSVPVSLSYHTGGLKITEPASWVGANWALNAGGAITRNVSGAPDERYTSTVSYQEKGYFSDNGYKSYPLDGPSGTENWSAIANGTRDGEPDMFFFNMPGYSGKFFFRDDRTPVFIPQQDIKVEYNYTGTGSIQSFTLTVPDGTAYSFGVTAASGDTDPVEKTDAYSSSTGYVTGTVISSWYLNKIESSDKRFSISLNYTQDNYAFNTLSLYPVANDNKTNSDQNDNYEYKMIRNRINGVRISSITASNMQINFIPGAARTDLSSYTSSNGFLESTGESAGNTLGEIQIADNASNVFKKYLLSYSYFSGSNSLASGIYFSGWSLEKDKTRLKLDKIQEQSMDGSIINPPCEFTYNNPGSVPRRLSFAQDHWGYFNGETGNNTLIPTYSKATDASGLNYQIVNGADREPNWPSMQNGSLKSIILRNGQNSEFLN